MTTPLRGGSQYVGGTSSSELSDSHSVLAGITPVQEYVENMHVLPPEVKFTNVVRGEEYVAEVLVQNSGTKPLRFRCFEPSSPCFSISMQANRMLAPGVCAKITVRFHCTVNEDLHDRFIIHTEGGRVEVPLLGLFPAPVFRLSNTLVDFGSIVPDQVCRKEITLSNEGSTPGEFSFSCDDPLVQIQPSEGSLRSGHSTTITFEVTPPEPGVIRSLVHCDFEKCDIPPVLDITANVVPSQVELVLPNSGGIIRDVAFPPMYVGQSTTKKVVLVNNSPNPASFAIYSAQEMDAEGDGASSVSTSQSDRLAEEEQPVSFFTQPSEGSMGPYSEQEIVVTFAPRLKERKLGFKSTSSMQQDFEDLQCNMIVDIVETEQRVEFRTSGRALIPKIALSQHSFRFGECAVNEKVDQLVTITNKNDRKEITFEFRKVAHFRADPPSGKLLPMQSRNVLLSFAPNQMGRHSGIMELLVGGGAASLPLRVSGVSSSQGGRKKLTGGPSALPADFQKAVVFAQPTEYRSNPQTRMQTRKPWEEKLAFEHYSDKSLKEYQNRKQHQALANQYIRSAHTDAEREQQREHDFLLQFENEVDIGLEPASGLESPKPSLRLLEDPPVFLEQPLSGIMPSKQMLDAISKKKNAHVFDENVILKKKFKSQAVTGQEIRECKTELTPKQLFSIVCGPRVIDFGRVSVFSTNVKSFYVANDLDQCILATFLFDEARETLQRSTPRSQVVPPGATTTFDITLYSETVESFQQNIYYTINDTHTMKFMVYAEIAPLELQLSREEISFKFQDTMLEASATEICVITNSSNADAHWSFEPLGVDSLFSVSPVSGVLPMGQSCRVNVTFTPGPNTSASEDLILKCVGGPDRFIHLKGSVGEARCAFQQRSLDFGVVPIGRSRELKATVRNTGENAAVFWVDDPVPGVTVIPSRGRIPVGGSQEFRVSVLASVPQVFQTAVSLRIRGGKPLRCPLQAEAQIPHVITGEVDLDFGNVYMGSSQALPLFFENDSPFTATLFIDLDEHMEFSLLTAEGIPVQDSTDSSITIVPFDHGQAGLLDVDSDEDDADLVSDDEDLTQDVRGFKYKLVVEPSQILHCALQFHPMEEVFHEFVLPLSLAGVPPAVFRFHRKVFGRGLKSRIALSQTECDFGHRVILGPRESAYSFTVNISNETYEEMTFSVGDFEESRPVVSARGGDAAAASTAGGASSSSAVGITGVDQSQPLFWVEPASGSLIPGEVCPLQVHFAPVKVGSYHGSLPIYLDGDTSAVYRTLGVKGLGSLAMLSFNTREVILPVVPLGVESKAVFVIVNQGYDNLELRHRLPADVSKVPLRLEFPEGVVVSKAKKELPVEVFFKSDKSMSFTGKVDFFDSDGNRFSIPVTGTCDNCLLTNFPFMSGARKTHRWRLPEKPDMPPFLEPIPEHELTDSEGGGPAGTTMSMYSFGASEVTSTIAAQSERQRRRVFSRSALRRMCEWLNANVLKPPMEDLLSEMHNSNGKTLFEIVETLSGKRVSGFIGEELSPSSNEAVMQLYTQYDELIKYLKSFGALLNAVRPENLLRFEDFQRYQLLVDQKSSQGGAFAPPPPWGQRRMTERRFLFRAAEAWVTVLCQTIKLFCLQRVSPRDFSSLPGIPASLASGADFQLSKSNVYSVSECILLKWVNYHHQKVVGGEEAQDVSGAGASSSSSSKGKGGAKIIQSFDEDLRDCVVYSSLILSHIPELQPVFLELNRQCQDSDDMMLNAELVITAMKEMNMEIRSTVEDLVRCSGREALMFVLYLYQTLPQYVPKASIHFTGGLHQALSKSIELTNPSPSTIEYFVRLDGDEEFSIKTDRLRIPPNSTEAFEVQCLSRYARPSRGKLSFVSHRVGNVQGTTIVFRLKAEPRQDLFLREISTSSPVYHLEMVNVEVTNIFPQAAKFQLQLLQERGQMVPSRQKGGPNPRDAAATGGGRKGGPKVVFVAEDPSQQATSYPDAFWSKTTRVNMKPGQTVIIPVQFLPFQLGSYRCTVRLTDPKLGELSYQILATGELPLPEHLDVGKLVVESGANGSRDVFFPSINTHLDRALAVVQQRFKEMKMRRKVSPILPTDRAKLEYQVEFESPFFSTTSKSVFLANPSKEAAKSSSGAGGAASSSASAGGSGGGGAEEEVNIKPMPLLFKPRDPGIYPTRVVLEGRFDLRVYELEAKCNPPGVHSELEFTVPARQSVIQEIPLTNKSSEPYTVKAFVKGSFFSGPAEVVIPPGENRNYQLTFRPQWICSVEGELVLENHLSGEKYTYILKGVGEDPLPEDHVRVETQARQKVDIEFKVPNISGTPDVDYEVETDLPFVSGDPHLSLKRSEMGVYVLSMQPLLAGTFSGSISFVAPNTRYVWYTVEMVSSRPPAEGQVEISAEVRKAVAVEIGITNPLDRPVEFEIILEGQGLLGDPFLMLGPSETATYELVYSPLRPGETTGAIIFSNEEVGEFWYQLELTSQPSAVTSLPEMICEVGTSQEERFEIDNPIGKEVTLGVSNSNPRNFVLSPSVVTLPPYGTLTLTVTYNPSSLNEPEVAEISLRHPEVGEFVYRCRGLGTRPSTMPQLDISGTFGRVSSHISQFRNPFPTPCTFNVNLQSEEQEGVFSLLLQKTRVNLAPFASLPVPFSFRPARMTNHRALLVIDANIGSEDLRWKIPILAIAEAPATVAPFKYKCKARTRLEDVLEFPLHSLEALAKPERVTYELEVPEEHRAVLKRALTFQPIHMDVEGPHTPIALSMVFMPLRPLTATCFLLVRKPSGGLWRFELQLEVLPPEVDDTIVIEAALHHTESVSFQMNNVFTTSTPFTASFTPESPVEFSVTPAAGSLAPYGQPGTQIIVSYTATSYGKPLAGHLHIDTDEMQWRYEVQGILPQYRAPRQQDMTTKIENRLPDKVQEALLNAHRRQPKNYVRENAKQLRDMARERRSRASTSGASTSMGSFAVTATATATGGTRFGSARSPRRQQQGRHTASSTRSRL